MTHRVIPDRLFWLLLAVVAAVTLASLVYAVSATDAARPAILSNCTRRVVTSRTGYTKCFDGTGLQRSKGYFSNGVDTAIIYGPWAGQDVASWVEGPATRSLVAVYVDHWP